jgi:hypothetical protein
MDYTTMLLIEAIEFALTAGKISAPDEHADRWTFQEGSEIHIVMIEAIRDARLATGMETPNPELLTVA